MNAFQHRSTGGRRVNPLFLKRCLVFGCGNPLLGDDGFGPQVIERLTADHALPTWVGALDVGTAIRDILFDLLLVPQKPERLIVVDAMDHTGRPAGEILEIDVDAISPAKIVDFSLHQFPTTNMLQELRQSTPMEVRVLVVQIAQIPETVRPGLSAPVQAAVPRMCARILEILRSPVRPKVGKEYD